MSDIKDEGRLTRLLNMSDNPIAVSSCLLGESCRYDGQSKPHPLVRRLAEERAVVGICPEVLGGLSTPRPPSGIKVSASDSSGSRVPLSAGSNLNCAKLRDSFSDAEDCEMSDVNAGALVWQGRACLINREGRDVTAEYKSGALKALAIAEAAGVKLAILKQHSPSCGCGSTGGAEPWRRIAGDGVAAALFKAHGIAVFSDEEL